MALPNSYTQKPNTVSDYFEATSGKQDVRRNAEKLVVIRDGQSTRIRVW